MLVLMSKVSLHSQGFLLDEKFLNVEDKNEDKTRKLKHLLKVNDQRSRFLFIVFRLTCA